MVALITIIACVPLVLLTVAAIDRHLRPQSRFTDSRLLSFCEFGSAWFLGLIFLSGGMSKLMPFPGVIGPVWLEEVLSEHGLGVFARFIAWSEALIGLLLLSKHFRVLGAIMLVPLLLNILMVTVSMNWRGTPFVIMFFLVNNMFLLAFHIHRWWPVVDSSMQWLRTTAEQKLTQSRFVASLSIVGIGIAPFLFRWHWSVSTTVIAASLAGLLWSEWVTRFQPNIRTTVSSSPADSTI